MMCFLIFNVLYYFINMTKTIRKRTKSFLPIKWNNCELLFVYERITGFFDFPYQIRKTTIGLHSDKNMNMIGHSVYGH